MSKNNQHKKKLQIKPIPCLIAFLVLVFIIVFIIKVLFFNTSQKEEKPKVQQKEPQIQQDVELTISFAGDCTLGNYVGQVKSQSFNQEYEKQGKNVSYFFKNVTDIFSKDDLTIVNLEGPLTTAKGHLEKQFAFSGLPEYARILTAGHMEAVTLANNHSEDYYQTGMNDTKTYLDKEKIGYFGYEDSYITDVKGIKIGFLGYRSMSVSMNTKQGREKIQAAINKLKNEQKCQLVFVYYHWGIEGQYKANEDQRSLAHFTIDAGADGVIGSHPHVIQGTEIYKDKPIAYSLGNFCFGGNRNPKDKDSMIYQLTYQFNGNTQKNYKVNIIPCRISTSKSRNNYQPTVLTGKEKERVLNKIDKYS